MTANRRDFIKRASAGGIALAAAPLARSALARAPDIITQTSADTQAPLPPPAGQNYTPVVTLNGWTLPWRWRDGAKEFHLVAEPVARELAPGTVAKLWGYNGQSPGPTIEVVEGDLVRLFVTNRLPEATSVHWHGQRLPNGMDGVAGLTQPVIEPGSTWVYEFIARRPGTFMYHPHADEMVQMAMGLMGFWVTHPKGRHPHIAPVQRDYAFLLGSFDIDPGASVPRVMTMTEFNLWTWNSRVFPGIAPLVARLGDRVRIRIGNLTMTNHPIHLHGHEFTVTGTDGGPVPPSARWPEVTTDVAVGQMRQIEFIASELGDWAFHCHKSHHTMNAMGHNVETLIGVDASDLVDSIQELTPGYMPMGHSGMHEMASMRMAMPANTVPMMTGQGPHGPIGMGGMFSVLKVRRDLPPGDHRDPGWYTQPPGSGARPVDAGQAPQATSAAAPAASANTLQVRKPSGHTGH